MNGDAQSHGLWEATAPAGPPLLSLQEDIDADVVIIGAGYTGLSAALHAAQRGMRVVLLEGMDVGFGGSGRNVGLVNAGLWVMPSQLRATLGEPFGTRLLNQLSDAPNLVFDLIDRYAIDCDLVRCGTLHCAFGERGRNEIAERYRQWKLFGAPVQLLDAEQTHRTTGTSIYAGALLDHRAGTIEPLAYANGLAHAALANGVRLYQRSPVLKTERLGANWRLQTPHGHATAPWVLLATNAYSTDAASAVRRELIRLPYFNLATRPLPPALLDEILPQRQGVWDSRRIMTSLRMDRAGRLVFGSIGAIRGVGQAIHPAWGRRALARMFPQLAKIEFEHEWYGWIGMTQDATPRLHRWGPQMFSISGYNGRGIAPGTSFGRDMARLASGEVGEKALSLPVTFGETARFASVRESFYELGAKVAHWVGARLPTRVSRSFH